MKYTIRYTARIKTGSCAWEYEEETYTEEFTGSYTQLAKYIREIEKNPIIFGQVTIVSAEMEDKKK